MNELSQLAPQIAVALTIVGAAFWLSKRDNGYARQESVDLLRKDVEEIKETIDDIQRVTIRLEERAKLQEKP